MRPGEPRRRKSAAGFTYIGLLVLVALIGFLLAVAGQVAGAAAQREREKQLLFAGHAYRNAIARFVRINRRFPLALAELVQSENTGPLPAHYLRHVYPDPMTGAADWTLIPALGGGIMGVASTSTRAPIKHSGFDDADSGFKDAGSYAEWIFTYDARLRGFAVPRGMPGIGTVH